MPFNNIFCILRYKVSFLFEVPYFFPIGSQGLLYNLLFVVLTLLIILSLLFAAAFPSRSLLAEFPIFPLNSPWGAFKKQDTRYSFVRVLISWKLSSVYPHAWLRLVIVCWTHHSTVISTVIILRNLMPFSLACSSRFATCNCPVIFVHSCQGASLLPKDSKLPWCTWCGVY